MAAIADLKPKRIEYYLGMSQPPHEVGHPMQALLAFLWSEHHGWRPFSAFRFCNLSWRLRQRLLWIRDGSRRVRRMAAHHHAGSDRRFDCWLRATHAGLRHREAPS